MNYVKQLYGTQTTNSIAKEPELNMKKLEQVINELEKTVTIRYIKMNKYDGEYLYKEFGSAPKSSLFDVRIKIDNRFKYVTFYMSNGEIIRTPRKRDFTDVRVFEKSDYVLYQELLRSCKETLLYPMTL